MRISRSVPVKHVQFAKSKVLKIVIRYTTPVKAQSTVPDGSSGTGGEGL